MNEDVKKDIFIFAGMFLLVGALWFYTGGPGRSTTLNESRLYKPEDQHSEALQTDTDRVTGDSSGSRYSGTTKTDGIGVTPGSTNEASEESVILEGQSQLVIGLPKAKLVVSSATKSQTDPDKEYLEIRVTSENKEPINISGWTIEGKEGLRIKLGTGIYLPHAGQVSNKQVIFAQPGSNIFVVTGDGPLGNSFRLNKCTGYFEQFQDFIPRLPEVCPYPKDEVLPRFFDNDDDCFYYVKGLPKCRIHDDPIPVNLSYECKLYIQDEINYDSCVALHKNNSDFYQNEWRIYLGRDEELWKSRRELITLRDENDIVLDWVSY